MNYFGIQKLCQFGQTLKYFEGLDLDLKEFFVPIILKIVTFKTDKLKNTVYLKTISQSLLLFKDHNHHII